MKKIILLFGVIIITTAGFAQSCFSKKDEITGKETKGGRVSLLPGSFMNTGLPMVALAKVGDDFIFEFVMKTSLGAENFDKEKMMCIVKFTDGTIKSYLPNSQSTIITASTGTTVALTSDITKADIDFIKATPIAFIRFSYKGDESLGYDNTINDRKAKQIMKSIDCLL